MDAVIFITFALILTVMQKDVKDNKDIKTVKDYMPEDTTRTAKLNDSFYEDEDAFMEIAHALGF